MKKTLFLIALVGAYLLLSAQPVNPQLNNLISHINADTLAAHVLHLQNYQTRNQYAGNQLEIATWLNDQFQSYGFTNSYLQEYQEANTTQYNVIATIPGYMYPESYVIVGAHYDSQSLNSSNLIWAPGADDNASGTAALLEMARVMKLTGFQPRYTIRFIAFSAEELGGAWGSNYYCDYAISENHDIRIMMNIDMIASNQPITEEFLIEPYTGAFDFFIEAMAISELYSNLVPVQGVLNSGSDSGVFHRAGFAAVFFRERYISPYWHTGEDVIDHLDFGYALKIARAATATAATYANQPPALEYVQAFDTGTGNSLLVEWESSPDPETSYYVVYYGTDEMDMDSMQSVSGNECLIEGLVEGQHYYVAVASVNDDGYAGNRSYSECTPLSVPRSPQGLADFPSSSSITISWTPNAELDIASYKVFRSFGADGASSLIASVNAPLASYTDLDVSSSLEYYYYRLQAIDSDGQHSQISEAISSRMVSLDRGILVIDESKNFNGTNPFQPTDEDVDEFYARVMDSYEQVEHLDLEEFSGTLRVADIGIYSSILWHGNDNSDYTYPYLLREVFRQYIYWGGQVLFSVYFPSKAFELNAGYPAFFPPESFMSEALGIGGVNYSIGARFKRAVPSQGTFPAMQVDSLKTLASWQGHSFAVEALEAVNPDESIYLYGSDYSSDSSQGVLNGSSVGVHHHYGSGQAISLSFPLYNMQSPDADAFLEHVFSTLFGEATSATPYTAPPIPWAVLSPSYPNPFSSSTSIRIQAKDTGQLMDLSIYNLRGQRIRCLYHDYPKTSEVLSWDGRDASGAAVGSGIYFIKASQNGRALSRKIMLLR